MKMLLSLMLAMVVSLTPVLSWMGVGLTPAQAQSQRGGLSAPVMAKVTDKVTNQVVTAPGTLTITRFVAGEVQGAPGIIAIGTVAFMTPNGGSGIAPFAFPVSASAVSQTSQVITQQQAPPGTCPILHLELAPLTLDLLGLVVELPNPLVLNIFADPGPGNLLGNLLCAITGLLDPPGPLGQLVAALNRLIAALGSL